MLFTAFLIANLFISGLFLVVLVDSRMVGYSLTDKFISYTGILTRKEG